MARWSFREDYIVGKFCLEHGCRDIYGPRLEELMNRLHQSGFNSRSEVAVSKRARDFTYLLRGWDSPYAVKQVVDIYKMLLDKEQHREMYQNIQSLIKESYNPDAEITLNNRSSDTPNLFDETTNLNHLVRKIEYNTTFPMVLQKYVELKKIKKYKTMCERIGMKPDTFSAILRGKYSTVKKENVLKLCVGLELHVSEAEELLKSAGYLLSDAVMTDVVIKAFLWERIYSVVAINAELVENEEPELFENYVIRYNID